MCARGALALLVAAAACTGQIGSGGAGPPATGTSMGTSGAGTSGATGVGPQALTVGVSFVRHLTRTEYNNTVHDLFGTTLTPADAFQPDLGASGFDKDSVSQTITPAHMQAFEAGSDNLVEAVFADPTLKGRLVSCDLATGNTCIRSTLEAFLPKAWRRPVQPAEVDQLMALAGTEAKAGGSAEEQLKLALRGALTSANFLYLIERDPDPSSTAAHKLDDYALASRLSYFLWSSMPDSALTAVAAQGMLQDDKVLAGQVTRMLADPKGSAMTNVFAEQWVQLSTIPDHEVDAKLFPMVTAALKQSMVQETKSFFQDVLSTGAPVRSLLAADYTFADSGLAKLYGLPAPQGSGLVKTSVTGTTRIGGLLGQASVLMQFANTVRTSAVKRGAWVLDGLLCSPAPPPPPAVALANAANQGQFDMLLQTETQRQFLSDHRAMAQCAVCHNLLDPIGLGLENYDAVGQYRTTDNNQPIDASGQLNASDDKTKFTDARGLAGLLASDDRLASCLERKLFTFALARAPTSDEVIYLATLTNGNGDPLTKMIADVVTSTPFRIRRGTGL